MVPKFRLYPLVLHEKPLPPHTGPALCWELEGRTSITRLGLTSGGEERTEKSPKTPRTNCAQPETTQPRHSTVDPISSIFPLLLLSQCHHLGLQTHPLTASCTHKTHNNLWFIHHLPWASVYRGLSSDQDAVLGLPESFSSSGQGPSCRLAEKM